MSTTQVSQNQAAYIVWRAKWSTGRLGFEPVIEKSEVPIRNQKSAPKLVLVYESEYQPTYSRTYNSLVLLVEEKNVQKLMKKLMELDELSTEEIIKFVCETVEHDVRRVSLEEDYEYYKRITIILK